MYALSRMLLMVASASTLVCLAVVAIVSWPTGGVVGVFVLVILWVRRGPNRLTTLGSARFATENELRCTGMIGAGSGLIVGRLPQGRRPMTLRLRRLFDRRVEAREACRQFWQPRSGHRHDLVRLANSVHTVVFAPTGAGKGVSLVIPDLFSSPRPVIVCDPKSELAKLTATHRRKRFGHRIVLLDPFKKFTKTPDTYNVFDGIHKDGRQLIDHCNDFAKAVVIRNPGAKEPHWDDSAELFIAAISAVVAQYGEPNESRSLQTVREFLTHPQKLDLAIRLLCESTCLDGMLARVGGQLSYFEGKERSSVLTTVGRHLRFCDTLAVAENTRTSSFDPSELRWGKMTIYLILPPEHTRALTPLLRLWVSSLFRSVIQAGVQS